MAPRPTKATPETLDKSILSMLEEREGYGNEKSLQEIRQ